MSTIENEVPSEQQSTPLERKKVSKKNNNIIDDNIILEIQTVQSSAFRTLIEALKEILSETNWEFTESGIKIVTIDTTHTVLVYMKLDCKNFEKYHCKKRMVLGIGMTNFFKLIKTMNNNDTLTLQMTKNNTNVLCIKIENSEKNSITRYNLNLMDIDEEVIEVPEAKFKSIISMPSNDFQKVIRDMSNLADIIEIKSIGSQLIFCCKGDFATQETIIGETMNGLSFVKENGEIVAINGEEIVQGLYSLKHLVLFTKCTNLSNNIELFIRNDYPIIVKYSVANLGFIRLCLAPKVKSDS